MYKYIYIYNIYVYILHYGYIIHLQMTCLFGHFGDVPAGGSGVISTGGSGSFVVSKGRISCAQRAQGVKLHGWETAPFGRENPWENPWEIQDHYRF